MDSIAIDDEWEGFPHGLRRWSQEEGEEGDKYVLELWAPGVYGLDHPTINSKCLLCLITSTPWLAAQKTSLLLSSTLPLAPPILALSPPPSSIAI
jgi:hypothetical protein